MCSSQTEQTLTCSCYTSRHTTSAYPSINDIDHCICYTLQVKVFLLHYLSPSNDTNLIYIYNYVYLYSCHPVEYGVIL